jgi:HAD superfamily hydrolase (TIGR01509 family)
VFLSFELSTRKPYDEIYKKIMEQVPFDSKDILFIDDSKKNIEVAEKFGWNTLHCTGKELDLIKEKCKDFLKED